jgi:hypothetical protein
MRSADDSRNCRWSRIGPVHELAGLVVKHGLKTSTCGEKRHELHELALGEVDCLGYL